MPLPFLTEAAALEVIEMVVSALPQTRGRIVDEATR
jgi:hypothetical protein